ncbi:arsenate reductase [Erythrobacter litoralis]|uniref:arsenate reductase n=1 Tax=Erythrobacter litoralis TaxID=39960 RepID=UPI0024354E46|nr:arsenate reductase [Erythrobacter litoralis]MDG6080068.1 arsenate reductase [Erythrobacter litoralis]
MTVTKVQIYGIPNCDSVRKARKWLDANAVPYMFHDFKKEGAAQARLTIWDDAVGWETLLNKRGTTFRKLSDAQKAALDREKAIALMEAQPSLIKRPVVEHDGAVLVGFDEGRWGEVFAPKG